MNKLFLIGNLTKEPESGETNSGIVYCRLSIAVNRQYSREEKETDFFNVTVWRSQAEHCLRYLTKGSKVAIVGSIQSRSYEDKDGNKKFVLDIVANEVEFLVTKRENKETEQANLVQVNEEDLPF